MSPPDREDKTPAETAAEREAVLETARAIARQSSGNMQAVRQPPRPPPKPDRRPLELDPERRVVAEVLREAKHVPERFELQNQRMMQLTPAEEAAHPPFSAVEPNTGETLTDMQVPDWARPHTHPDSMPPGNDKAAQALEISRFAVDLGKRTANTLQKVRHSNEVAHAELKQGQEHLKRDLGVITVACSSLVALILGFLQFYNSRHPVKVEYVQPPSLVAPAPPAASAQR